MTKYRVSIEIDVDAPTDIDAAALAWVLVTSKKALVPARLISNPAEPLCRTSVCRVADTDLSEKLEANEKEKIATLSPAEPESEIA